MARLVPRRSLARSRSALVALALTLLATPGVAGAAPLWSSMPSPFECGPDGRIVPNNSCLAHTGFRPNVNYDADWRQMLSSKGNCTKYVAFRLRRNGVAPLASSFGNAVGWRGVVRSRLGAKAVDDTPAVAAIAWWGAKPGIGPDGHVAYVEHVSADGRTVYLSESHFDRGSRRRIVRKGSAFWPDDFLHVKDKPKPRAPVSPPASPTPRAPPPVAGPWPVSAPAPPKGHLDVVSSPAVGQIRVRGWSFDPNAPAEALSVHAYVGGKNHKIVTADLPRSDVASVFAGAENPGPNHGFDATFPTRLTGRQDVCVYAINLGSGPNPSIGCKAVTVQGTPPPPPPQAVTIAKGGSAQGMPGCRSSYCRYVVVTFQGFSAAGHTIRCRASHGSEAGWYAYTRSGPSGTSAVCYYGFPGHTVWVTVDSVSSNRVVW